MMSDAERDFLRSLDADSTDIESFVDRLWLAETDEEPHDEIHGDLRHAAFRHGASSVLSILADKLPDDVFLRVWMVVVESGAPLDRPLED